MRKTGSARKRPASGIRWDEQNLQDNEVIKATISKTKINEPKTPYHGPLGDQHMEDVEDGLQPLELDSHQHNHQEAPTDSSAGGSARQGTGSEPAAGTSTPAATAVPEACTEAAPSSTDEGGPGAAPAEPSESAGSKHPHAQHGHGYAQAHGLHAHFESSLLSTDAAAAEPESRSGFSSDSERRASLTGGSDGEVNEEEARRKFEQRRRAHYNMRAALRRARVLLSEDGEGEPDVDKDGAAADDAGADDAGDDDAGDDDADDADDDVDVDHDGGDKDGQAAQESSPDISMAEPGQKAGGAES